MMFNPKEERRKFENQSFEYFSNLEFQHEDQDRFTSIRQNVIRYVEKLPLKSCESGWTYDHSLVFNTISSEVR